MRAAADAAKQAAGVARALELNRVAELAAALPGTESARTAGELGPHWEGAADKWAQGMDSYATALTTAAKQYATRDNVTGQGFDRMGGH